MILTFLLQAIYSFLSFLLGLLPSGSAFPTDWVAGVYAIWGYINAFSWLVPVNVLLAALFIAVSFHLFVFAWKILHWIYGLIRGAKYH